MFLQINNQVLEMQKAKQHVNMSIAFSEGAQDVPQWLGPICCKVGSVRMERFIKT